MSKHSSENNILPASVRSKREVAGKDTRLLVLALVPCSRQASIICTDETDKVV